MFSKLRTLQRTYQTNGLSGVGQLIARKLSPPPPALVPVPQPATIDISDEFISWLCFANAGMLTRGNLYCFDYAIQNLPPNTALLEIGSFCGLSTNAITYYKKKRGVQAPLFSCDKWEFQGADKSPQVGDSALTHTDYRNFVKGSFLRNLRLFSGTDLPFTIEMFSDEFFGAWRSKQQLRDVFDRPVQLGGSFGFCYIDGNHDYEFARRDFENCDACLAPGGFILFDDSADGSGWEVCRVVEEISRSDKYELVIKNPNYLFKKK